MFSFFKSTNYLKISVVLFTIATSLSCSNSLTFTQAEMDLIGSDSIAGKMRLFIIDNPADTLVLRSISTDLTKTDFQSAYYSTLKKRMMVTVLDTANTGVGIAAPQVGINKRLIIVQRYDKVGGPYECYANARLLELSQDCSLIREGCLSVPNRQDSVMRSNMVVVSYLDDKSFTEKIDTIRGFTAVIFQHEIDHLEGILYIDKAASRDKMMSTK
ncbi:MAG: peptide deformylase [Bacteroidales bacterium]